MRLCVCTDRSDVDMVRCCNIECHLGTWFHADCVNLDVLPAADELWWCSDECSQQHQLGTDYGGVTVYHKFVYMTQPVNRIFWGYKMYYSIT